MSAASSPDKSSRWGPFSYLSSTSSVLRGTAGDELGVVVLQQVLVEAHVLLLGQNGIVGLQAVLLEKFLISSAE